MKKVYGLLFFSWQFIFGSNHNLKTQHNQQHCRVVQQQEFESLYCLRKQADDAKNKKNSCLQAWLTTNNYVLLEASRQKASAIHGVGIDQRQTDLLYMTQLQAYNSNGYHYYDQAQKFYDKKYEDQIRENRWFVEQELQDVVTARNIRKQQAEKVMALKCKTQNAFAFLYEAGKAAKLQPVSSRRNSGNSLKSMIARHLLMI